MKTSDHINRVNLTLPLSVYEGTWTHSPPVVAMHLLDRSCVSIGIFLKLHAMFPNSFIMTRTIIVILFCIRWLADVCLSHLSRIGFDEKGPYEG